MFVLSNFVFSLAKVLEILLTILYWLVLVRALVSWVNPDPSNAIVQLLYRTTEPLLEPIRRFFPASAIDLSPIVVFLIIIFLKSFFVSTLFDIGYRLR